MKYCNGCERDKPLDDFHDKRRKSGNLHKESKCKECVAKRRRAWSENNAQHVAEYNKTYYRDNSDRLKEDASQWRKQNPTKTSEYARRYDALKLAATVEVVDYLKVYERDSWICQLCLVKIDLQLPWPDPWSKVIDHKIPLSKGGAHSYENVQAAHMTCNASKSAKML